MTHIDALMPKFDKLKIPRLSAKDALNRLSHLI